MLPLCIMVVSIIARMLAPREDHYRLLTRMRKVYAHLKALHDAVPGNIRFHFVTLITSVIF